MVQKIYKGQIKARIIELRFAFSGKVAFVSKKKGDSVKKWEAVAGLDKKTFQAELDKQLADFEKVRAEFEIFNLQKGEPANDITKYLKTQKQAELNAAVKEVELAKAKLDQADLISPVEGIVIDDSHLVPGINITPASNPVSILETSSYFFEAEIGQKDLPLFADSRPMTVQLDGLSREIEGKTKKILPSEKTKAGTFLLEVELGDVSGLLLGMTGEASSKD